MQQLNVERSPRICFLHETYTPINITTRLPPFFKDVCLHFQKAWGGRKEESSTSLREFGSVRSNVQRGEWNKEERWSAEKF